MRLLKREISAKDGTGMVRLLCEETEDMYSIYQLLGKGDLVRASTVRKVVQETSTGSVQSSRLRMTLTVAVEDIEYDADRGALRIKGRNREQNAYVKLGGYHTLELEVNKDFSVRKARWDAWHLELLDEAVDVSKRAQIAAVVMQMGLAHVCLVTSQLTIVRSRVEQHVAKKRSGDSRTHDKAVEVFFKTVLDAVVRHVNFDVVKVLLVASPGFVKEEFLEYMDQQLSTGNSPELSSLRSNRSKVIPVHASSGHKHALTEVLGNAEVQAKIQGTRAAEEVAALSRFFQALNDDDGRACYSFAHVRAALDVAAVESLLMCDDLMRTANFSQRRRYVGLMEDARAQGAAVFVLSRMHTSGEQLFQLSGIAAVLRYAINEFEDAEDAVEEEDDNAGPGGERGSKDEAGGDDSEPVEWGEGW